MRLRILSGCVAVLLIPILLLAGIGLYLVWNDVHFHDTFVQLGPDPAASLPHGVFVGHGLMRVHTLATYPDPFVLADRIELIDDVLFQDSISAFLARAKDDLGETRSYEFDFPILAIIPFCNGQIGLGTNGSERGAELRTLDGQLAWQYLPPSGQPWPLLQISDFLPTDLDDNGILETVAVVCESDDSAGAVASSYVKNGVTRAAGSSAVPTYATSFQTPSFVAMISCEGKELWVKELPYVTHVFNIAGESGDDIVAWSGQGLLTHINGADGSIVSQYTVGPSSGYSPVDDAIWPNDVPIAFQFNSDEESIIGFDPRSGLETVRLALPNTFEATNMEIFPAKLRLQDPPYLAVLLTRLTSYVTLVYDLLVYDTDGRLVYHERGENRPSMAVLPRTRDSEQIVLFGNGQLLSYEMILSPR